MNNSFWTNTIWYVALAAISAAALAVIFIKAPERKKTFAFWFAVLGITYWLEISLVLLFNAYTYYPVIRPDDPFFDAVLGNIFSQVSVSSSAVLICVFGLSNWWLAGFSAAYFIIDVLFVQLGIYEHFWYQSVFTLFGFLIYGLAVKFWFKRLFISPSKWVYYPTLFLSAFAASANLTGTTLKLLDMRVFRSAFFSDPSRNHTSAAFIYGSVMIIIMIALHKWKPPVCLKILVFLLVPVCQWGLLQYGVMEIKPGWELVVLLFDIAVFYGCVMTMDWCLREKQKRLQ